MDKSHPDGATEDVNSLSSGCPWLNKKSNPILAPPGSTVNPLNQMPDLPQSQAVGQQGLLSTDREVSSIPKTGEAKKWEYPSPQQFYHALLRRNKSADEDTMDAVVFVHNNVNEQSWAEIMRYEAMHSHHCAEPSLQRFVGNSEKISPKAQFVTAFSNEELFDRHDWFVDRCGRKSVRYVIDYYDTSNTAAADGRFNVRIDARPAIDDLGNLWDRIRFPFVQWFGNWMRPVPPTGQASTESTSGEYVAG